ncbi:TonB-dependent receptor [Sphingomonas sp.]|uniref:TonB-dependent receptor n=1 Tax=Sphingomonas sp. TaxID=28214 RepID=UPI0025D91A3C|nr:TonB-dependent receptor [Sphingomonas sp.]MBV9528071.1 TonB-dependent receptor [Sphingomonas sp.]
MSHAIEGSLDARAALNELIRGTGLEIVSDKGGIIVLRLNAFMGNRSGGAENGSDIVVTAQKQSQRAKDVPIPLAVVNTGNLTDNGKVLLKDYYNTIPGLQITPSYEQNTMIAIRGITTGSSAIPTVGFVIDDVPFGSPIAQGNSLPDIDPGDLERIEVLRGPQGALYGASSMGGLIKFVTRTPSTDRFSGRVEAGISAIENGAQAGYQVRGAFNIPISDNLAVRLSGFRRQEPGCIDDPSIGRTGVNELRTYGGRFSVLWKVGDNVSIIGSALYQSDRGDGVSDVTVGPGLGDLQQKFIPGTGASHRVTEAYSLTVKADLGSFHIVSLTGYNKTRYRDNFDFSAVFGGYVNNTFGVSGAPYADDFQPENLTEELRLTKKFGDRIDWVVGGFLADDTNNLHQTAYAANPTTGQIVGVGDDGYYHYKYHEYAVFTDLTFHATDRLSVQVGGRYSSLENITGPYSIVEPIFTGNTNPVIQKVLDAHFHPATYLVTPQYKITKDLMVYARFASGFRPGGGNLLFPGVPVTFNPDKTYNYEVGLKGDLIGHKLSIDASLYYVDWKNIQVFEYTPTYHGYTGNGGRAKSEGVEVALTARPWTGFTASGWVDYDKAVLTDAFPTGASAYGGPGDRLPSVPAWSANGTIRQEWPIGTEVTAYAGGTITYVGDRQGTFLAAGQTRQNFPAYTQVDLSIGAKWKGWETNIYVNNVTDKRGVLEGGVGYSIPTSFFYIRPRIVGVSVSKSF